MEFQSCQKFEILVLTKIAGFVWFLLTKKWCLLLTKIQVFVADKDLGSC